jgi:hypothetical protein
MDRQPPGPLRRPPEIRLPIHLNRLQRDVRERVRLLQVMDEELLVASAATHSQTTLVTEAIVFLFVPILLSSVPDDEDYDLLLNQPRTQSHVAGRPTPELRRSRASPFPSPDAALAASAHSGAFGSIRAAGMLNFVRYPHSDRM